MRQISKEWLTPMLLRAFTLQDRMAVFTPSVGNSPQSLLIPEPYLGVSEEVLSGPGQNHPRNHWGDLVVEMSEFYCLDRGGTS